MSSQRVGELAQGMRRLLHDLHAKLNAGGRVRFDDIPWHVLWQLPILIDRTTLSSRQAIQQISRAFVEQLEKDKLAQATKKPQEDDTRVMQLHCQFAGTDVPPNFVAVVSYESDWLQAKEHITLAFRIVAEKWFGGGKSAAEYKNTWYQGFLPIEHIRWVDETKQGALQDSQDDNSWTALKKYCRTHNDRVKVELRKYHVRVDKAALEAIIAQYQSIFALLVERLLASTRVSQQAREEHAASLKAAEEAARRAAEEQARKAAAEEEERKAAEQEARRAAEEQARKAAAEEQETAAAHRNEDNQIVNGVLTYYRIADYMSVAEFDNTFKTVWELNPEAFKRVLFGEFGLPFPSQEASVKIEVKPCARYEVAPISYKAKITIRVQISVDNHKQVDLFYCGIHKLSKTFVQKHNIQECFSPPKLEKFS